MRSAILSYLKTLSLGTFVVADHLPWEDNGGPLYHHNKKHIYVDTPQSQQAAVFDAFNSAGFVNETTTVKVYFVNDAKKLPDNYEAVVDAIKEARTIPATTGYVQKLCSATSEYIADSLLTTIEFSFTKTITN